MPLERAIRRSLGPLPLISLLLVACANGGGGGGSAQGSVTDPAELTGVVWVLDDASIAGLVDEVPSVAQVTIAFDDGQAQGSAACNSYGGGYQADDDGSLSFEAFAITAMACDPPLMALEAAYTNALAGVTGFEIGSDGALQLTNGEVTMTYAPQTQPSALPLVGTTWTLTSIFSGDAVTSVVSGTEITAAFTEDDAVAGSAGCNRYSGTYEWSDDHLSFSALATTKMACADYVMAQEGVFLDAMAAAASFTIEGTELTLLDDPGDPLLGFTGTADQQPAG